MRTGFKLAHITAAIVSLAGASLAVPPVVVTGWYTVNSSQYAQVIEYNGGTPVTTWPSTGLANTSGGQATPAYSDIQQVRYSATFAYVNATGLASYTMGPWYLDPGKTQIFGNWPEDQSMLARFPLTPTPATTHTTTGYGAIGLMINGVALFNGLDTYSYKNSSGQDFMGMGGDGYWYRLAIAEAPSFDPANAHQPGSGQYHFHTNPYGIRYQLNDNLIYSAGTYSEKTSGLTHSPLLGFAFDGYPIYGPYGYSSANNPASSISRMRTGYVLRNGSNGTTNLTSTGRHSLPQWSATAHGHSTTLTSGQYGPNVSASFPLGRYAEDYDYLGAHGFVQGTDFDLDQYNGRQCVTPEYPGGTYAYFVAVDASGNPAYPYVVGEQFYGVLSGGTVASLAESTTTYFPSPSGVGEWQVY